MSTTTIVSPTPVLFNEARVAVAGFLARYSGPTRTSYATDLRQFFGWCTQLDLEVFAVQWSHVELWARAVEERGLSRATIGRKLSTVVGFYRIAVLDGLLEHSPAEHVRRPKIDTDSATLGLDCMELSAFVAQGAAGSPVDHALACLLGLLGLRCGGHRASRTRPTQSRRPGPCSRGEQQAHPSSVTATSRPSGPCSWPSVQPRRASAGHPPDAPTELHRP
jgi:hypothetical protein